MIKYLLKTTTLCASVLFSGTTLLQAASNTPVYQTQQNQSLDSTVQDLATKLLTSSRVNPAEYGDIAITSFVDLNQFRHTTHLGRSLSESMVNELFARGFDISDFRGQNTISVNSNGEYFLTRDNSKMKRKINNNYVLVGTFTTADNAILINARIMDNTTGHIVAAARTYYNSKDCAELGTCPKKRIIKIRSDKYTVSRKQEQKVVATNDYSCSQISFNRPLKKANYKPIIDKSYKKDTIRPTINTSINEPISLID